MDDIFEFLQTVRSHLGNVVNHDHRIDAICFLGPIFEYVPQ